MTERPEYLRIAGVLRDQITTGQLPAGARLPTLPELCATYGVSETTARNAMGVLRGEGLVESRTRAGTVVRERPPVHRLAADRYRTPAGGPPQTAFTRDQGIGWSEYKLDKKFEQVRAGANLAALFEVEPGELLLARHFVFYDSDAPTQMSTSYLRWSDVGGTPVADPIHEPWPGGTRAQLATLGIEVVRITEAFSVGMPSEEEATTLRIGSAVPVIRFTRRHLAADGRVVEVAHPIVRRGDATVVEFAIDLED
ncbi:GntR family transcriptional regulator [Streptomyces sp. NPDC020983]|uniref:GntR family transcriptional regulator n=1 Tax=Streptomyces sp. NPDC020983 TaxID=3365106 RepID=UPI0037A647E0